MFVPRLVRPFINFMCASWQPMYWVMLAGLALQGASMIMGAKAGKDAQASANAAAYKSELQGAKNEGRSMIEAQYAIQRAKEESDRIKQQAVIRRGTQIAAQAASGVVVGNGSARAMVDETQRLAQQDAIAVLKDGARGYTTGVTRATDARDTAQAQATSQAAQGKSLLSQSVATALGTAGNMMNTYATYNK